MEQLEKSLERAQAAHHRRVPHCPPGKYGPPSCMMALITSGCGRVSCSEEEIQQLMAITTKSRADVESVMRRINPRTTQPPGAEQRMMVCMNILWWVPFRVVAYSCVHSCNPD